MDRLDNKDNSLDESRSNNFLAEAVSLDIRGKVEVHMAVDSYLKLEGLKHNSNNFVVQNWKLQDMS